MNARVVQYTLVVAPTTESLIESVNLHIKHGWQPFGGVSVTTSGEAALCQAMVGYGGVSQ
jgi:hypothetical protein